MYKINATPNDSYWSSLWGLHQSNDADIDAPEAWDISKGNDVVIAVIDTGVDYNHPDLVQNMWTNSGEIPGNNIDDDNNGFIDDVYGWDFANGDGNPIDGHNHGTHVAGTIAAKGNNNLGVVGVNWNARIMALKGLSDGGSGYISNLANCLIYAVDNGAKISNNSWGGGGYSQAMNNALNYAKNNGHLFIAAAGNDYGNNNDSSPHYPSSYSHDNIIAVAATNQSDNLASFSNYGANSVDIAALGVSILSTVRNGGYSSYNGTSMATPHVAGVAGLLLSHKSSLSYTQIRDALLNNVDTKSSLQGKVVSNGRLNAHKALSSIAGSDPEYPDVINIDSSTQKKAEYKAGKKIIAGGGFTVLSSETIKFSAGEGIDINPDFNIEPGASFDEDSFI
ncbi:MAG: S8 family serine peptidase [Desulfobacteraceae bacterium]|nr:S8 family serine peptidase [Desulfobacteraceae bacterium]